MAAFDFKQFALSLPSTAQIVVVERTHNVFVYVAEDQTELIFEQQWSGKTNSTTMLGKPPGSFVLDWFSIIPCGHGGAWTVLNFVRSHCPLHLWPQFDYTSRLPVMRIAEKADPKKCKQPQNRIQEYDG
jgi:hypothetical protein